jgi:hypothetical protein
MSEARLRDEWERTSWMIAYAGGALLNDWKPSDFNPFAERQSKPLSNVEGRDVLKLLEQKAKARAQQENSGQPN